MRVSVGKVKKPCQLKSQFGMEIKGNGVRRIRRGREDLPADANEVAVGHDVDEADVIPNRVFSMKDLDLIGRNEEGFAEVPGAHDAGFHLALHWRFREEDIDFRLVRSPRNGEGP